MLTAWCGVCQSFSSFSSLQLCVYYSKSYPGQETHKTTDYFSIKEEPAESYTNFCSIRCGCFLSYL